MNDNLLSALRQIENLRFTQVDNTLIVTTDLEHFVARFEFCNVTGFEFVNSPFNERCLKVDFLKNGYLIITPNDFVFNTINNSILQVTDLPPIISIREMLDSFNHYLKNPEPTNNLDATVGFYFLNKFSLLSAKQKNFDVEQLLEKLEQVASQTSVYEEITSISQHINELYEQRNGKTENLWKIINSN